MSYQTFAPAQIQGFANALAEEASHDQLTELYGVVLGEDRSPQRSRSKRLRSHMLAAQAREQTGDEVVRLIEAFMHPARFISVEAPPEDLTNTIQALLHHSQLTLTEEGKVVPSAEAPGSPAEQAQHREDIAQLLARMETLEREGRVTRDQMRILRKKLAEVEKNLSKVSSSSIRDQIQGAFFASMIGALVNRENFVAIVQAVGSAIPVIGHQGP